MFELKHDGVIMKTAHLFFYLEAVLHGNVLYRNDNISAWNVQHNKRCSTFII